MQVPTLHLREIVIGHPTRGAGAGEARGLPEYPETLPGQDRRGVHLPPAGEQGRRGVRQRTQGEQDRRGVHLPPAGEQGRRRVHQRAQGVQDKGRRRVHQRAQGVQDKGRRRVHQRAQGVQDKGRRRVHQRAQGEQGRHGVQLQEQQEPDGTAAALCALSGMSRL